MTNAEAIRKLEELPGENELTIWIRTATQNYSVAQVTPFSIDGAGIWIQLPDNMYTVTRKKTE